MSKPLFSTPNGHLHLQANTDGRDFIVGDLHGCRQLLEQMLEFHDFDPAVDRVFCCGDLIDRGPDSMGTLALLRERWFYCVKGNHELMFESWLLGNEYPTHSRNDFIQRANGGIWAELELQLGNDELYTLADLASRLPLVISVGEGEDRFNLVHAELRVGAGILLDAELDTWNISADWLDAMTWGRQLLKIRGLTRETAGEVTHTGVFVGERPIEEGLSLTYAGHSILDNPLLYRSHVFMDAGAYKSGRLHLLQHGWHHELVLTNHGASSALV